VEACSINYTIHESDDRGRGAESLLRLQSAASAGLESDVCLEDWAKGWVLELLLSPSNAVIADAVRSSSRQDEEAMAATLRAAAVGPACLPRNDQIRVARLAAADTTAACGEMERWAAEVRESADLGPLVPTATQLAAALMDSLLDGRLQALLPGCQIAECQPLLLDMEGHGRAE
jgi:hypothetical protein